MLEKKYTDASLLLEDVRNHMDWEGMNSSRKRGVRDEFTNKVKALSRCYSSLSPFLDKLCKSFSSSLGNEKTQFILNECDEQELMNVFRRETQVPVLLMKIRKSS